jgi:nuclear pore complex protein Nup98-Nup96
LSFKSSRSKFYSSGAFSGGTSTFGGTKPAPGFGAFSGGNTTFGGGGTFGAGTNATTGGLFGQTSTGTGTGVFGGAGGGIFSGGKIPTTFGSTGNTLSFPLSLQWLDLINAATAMDNVPPVTTGTGVTPWAAHIERETTPQGGVDLRFQTITCMPVYRGTSLEVSHVPPDPSTARI